MARGKQTEEKSKITCSSCGNDRDLNRDFYASNSPFHKHTGKLHMCKQCFWDFVNEDTDKLKQALRMIDKPFISELLKSSQTEAEETGKNFIKLYMKNIGMHQYKTLTWDDSDFEGHKSSSSISTVNVQIEEPIYDYNALEMKRKWGTFTDEEYFFLENFYGEYAHSYATDTPVQVNLYRNIAKVHLQAEKELAQANTKQFKELMELSSKLHNDGNIKPIQSTGANDDKGLSTYGLWIKTIEQDEPCEFFENKPVYEDFDKFKKYIDEWFVRPFKNIFNISKDFNVRDDD